jgi:LytS/YehU family sensor histidine kinase
MRRSLVWLQIIIGWLPIWALYTLLITAVHTGTRSHVAALIALRMVVAAAILGIGVQRLTERYPWPHPFRVSFVALHTVGAAAYSVAFLLLNSVIESLVRQSSFITVMHGEGVAGTIFISNVPGAVAFMMSGVWMYVMITGVSYATRATERAALAEAEASRAQLSALRSQLNPHFLFNALHTIVQLIPRQPDRAAQAAEQLGALLRDTIEEDRDLVSFAEERAFVERYLAVQRLRFGDRLQVRIDVTPEADDALVPSFALLTLVENAVRHGAEPNVDATEIVVHGSTTRDSLVLTVEDSGVGGANDGAVTNGTGLKRLRERLVALYDSRARLETTSRDPRGFLASLTIPRVEA